MEWLVAGTPQYVAASWFGYDKNQKLTNKQTSAARNLWNKAMLALHEDLEPMSFVNKGTTVEAAYCAETGELATADCPKTNIGVYKPDFMPDFCSKHGTGENHVVTTPTGATTSTDGTTTTTDEGTTTTAP